MQDGKVSPSLPSAAWAPKPAGVGSEERPGDRARKRKRKKSLRKRSPEPERESPGSTDSEEDEPTHQVDILA